MNPDPLDKKILVAVENLEKNYPLDRRTKIRAVSHVDFVIRTGETLGLVGESGCGKSTLARCIVCLEKPAAGRIWFDEQDLTRINGRRLKQIRPQFQMIFQDAAASLNPGRTIGKSIQEPLRVSGTTDKNQRQKRARAMMAEVGLDPDRMYHRYPFQLSGGQCQRVGLARALITRPRFLVCDEPVSSLDVSVQARILNLLKSARERFGLTMLFISHDLAVVKNISDRVAVMYLGRLCEIADCQSLYDAPRHPYSKMLLDAIAGPDAGHSRTETNKTHHEMPSPAAPPPGCRFHTRCPGAKAICRRTAPEWIQTGQSRRVACHFPL